MSIWRVPNSEIYLWRDKFGNGFTGTAANDQFLEVAKSQYVYSNQKRPFWKVITRFPRLGIDADMGNCSDLLTMMEPNASAMTWPEFLKKCGIKPKQNGYKDVHNMNFVIAKRSGTSANNDMWEIKDSWTGGGLDIYMHEVMSYKCITKIYLRCYRRNE